MVNAGTLTVVLLIFGPFVLRKYVDWQAQRKQKRQQSSSQHHYHRLPIQQTTRLPLPLSQPSNALIIIAFLLLIAYHSSTLLLTSRYALRTDLFLLLNRSVNTPSVVLATLLETFPRHKFGWRSTWTQEGLTTLIRRLSSLDGRKLHLLLGIDPFISCTFCDSSRDYLYFSLATRIMQYGVDLFLLGILTLRFDALNTFDDVVLLIFDLIRGKDTSAFSNNGSDGSRLRPHRHQWRKVVKYFVAVCALCEIAILSGFYEIGLGQGRWSHWYANRNIVWHGSMLFLSCIIFVSPRTPHVPALLQIAQSLHRSELLQQDLRANLQAAHLTSQIVWQDEHMREKMIDFYVRFNEGELDDIEGEGTDEMVERLAIHAQAARVDVAQLRAQSKQAAHAIWSNSETIWQDEPSIQTSTVSSPISSQNKIGSSNAPA